MSEKLSSKNLFHFTKKSVLENILKNKFYAMYCKEEIFSTVFNKKHPPHYIPMVSFCNIPLTMVKNHCKLYGSYGIGLTKRWALRNKINPVLYSYRNSAYMKTYNTNDKQFKLLEKYLEKNKFPATFKTKNRYVVSPKKIFLDSFKKPLLFLKPIEGLNKRGEKAFFYDEKEWRYVPELFNMNNAMIAYRKVKKSDFRYPNREKVRVPISSIKHLNQKILKHGIRHFQAYRLSFELSDIKFIILKNDKDIPDMIKFINKVFDGEDKNKLKTLVSKILTLEQFKEDF